MHAFLLLSMSSLGYLSGTSSADSEDIWLIGMLPFTGFDWDAGESMRFAANMMLDQISHNKHILPGYRLRIVWQDEQCSADRARKLFLQNMIDRLYARYSDWPHNDTDGDGLIATSESIGDQKIWDAAHVKTAPVGLFGAGCSPATLDVTNIAHAFRLPIVSPASSRPALSDREKFPNFFRTIVPDTGFGVGWFSLCRMLSIKRVVPIVGETSQWSSSFVALVKYAKAFSIELVGSDLSGEVLGLKGYQINADSWTSTMGALRDVKLAGVRVSIVFMYAKRTRLLMCAAAAEGLFTNVWMGGPYHAPGWWTSEDYADVEGAQFCSKEFVSIVANGFVQMNVKFWRPDLDTALTCGNMTAASFQQLYYTRQNVSIGSNVLSSRKYVVMGEGSCSADAVCMYALALHELLLQRGKTVTELGALQQATYEEFVDVLSHSEFQGLQGYLKYEPGTADPTGSFAIAQFQVPNAPCFGPQQCGVTAAEGQYENIATVTVKGDFLFRAPLVFHYENEVFNGSGAGRSIDGALSDFPQCPSGQVFEPSLRKCASCPANRTFLEAVQSCVCKRGFYSSAGVCINCPRGRYTRTAGSLQCTECSEGKFAELLGQTACTDCQIGRYANYTDQSMCVGCPPAKTTMHHLEVGSSYQWILVSGSSSKADCMCAFQSRPRGETCATCDQEGLVCEGDAHIKFGYYADVDYAVFKCSPPERCKGGVVGATCESGRTGIACAECVMGKAPAEAGKCSDCTGSDIALFLVLLIIAVITIVGTYYVIDSENLAASTHSMLMAGTTCGQLITSMQLLSVVGTCWIDFPEPLSSLLSIMSFIFADHEQWRFHCVASTSTVIRFAWTIAGIFIMAAIALTTHCLFVVFRYSRNFKSQFPSLIAMMGTVCTVFFISVVSIVIIPLQCIKHPNGQLTIAAYRGVLCWESDEHRIMLVLGLLALLFPLAFVAVCVQIVAQFPRKMRAMDTQFLQAYSFVFLRVKPEAYWYGLVITGRNLCFSFTPAIPNAALQIFTLQTLLMALLILSIWFQPWRVKANNYIDIASNAGIMLFLTPVALFVTNIDKIALSWICTIGIICFLSMFPVWILYGLNSKYGRRSKRYQFFLCHHKRCAGAYARMLKMYLLEQPRVRRKVFVDCDDLSHLNTLFDTVGSEVDCLLVIGSNTVFGRPWCIGEIVTAHTKKVHTRIIQLPEFVEMGQSMIDAFSPEMEGMCVLAESGISTEMIRDALRFIMALPAILVPETVNHELATSLASKLAAGCVYGSIEADSSASVAAHLKRSGSALVSAVVLCDIGVAEVSAAALVLQKMLLALHIHVSIVYNCCRVEVPKAVALFSGGCLERAVLPRFLIEAARQELQVVPLLIEESFRVPSPSMIQQLVVQSPVANCEATPGELAAVVAQIFTEIAKEFPVGSDSEALLKAHAQVLAVRIASDVSSVGNLTDSQRVFGSMVSMKRMSTQEDVKVALSASRARLSNLSDMQGGPEALYHNIVIKGTIASI